VRRRQHGVTAHDHNAGLRGRAECGRDAAAEQGEHAGHKAQDSGSRKHVGTPLRASAGGLISTHEIKRIDARLVPAGWRY
jgi:hypothetical protein